MRYFSIALSMADSASAASTRPTYLIPAPISEMRKAPAMSLLVVLDLVGTFVFAISGASAGVTRRLDLFGPSFYRSWRGISAGLLATC
jgi:hypothetical protein